MIVGVSCTLSQAVAADPPFPFIDEASANLTTGLLTIQGHNFGTTPHSMLLGTTMLVVPSGDWTANQIVAQLPTDVPPDTYPLIVNTSRFGRSITGEVTIGDQDSVDPTGLQGPVGPAGPQGPQALRGQRG